ncbi:hypothetical protein ONK29_25565, partial [Salmonella enterica subsp. enterica serovar Anatum]|nr:hypothetical protein [Salmonella enterica subsp. enterica serovar Anatum]
IKDVLVYLNNNYREKITLDQLSKKFRASVSYICHEFAKEYHIPTAADDRAIQNQ